MSRRVQVDDTDGGFRYSSGWSAIPGDQYNNAGNFGSTYQNTLHSATTAASFTYSFNGADGIVYGTINIQKNSAGVIDPTWECLVDGKSIPLKDPFPYTENNWNLCSWDSSIVPFGQHTLTVNVKSGGRAFLFDYFTYVPSPNANVNNAGIRLACTDSALKYGSGWQVYGDDLGRLARAGGAPVSLTFYGTGIMWYGTAPTELPHDNSIASYSIDGKPSTTFTVPGTPSALTQYVRFYFQTPTLPLGHHTIVITSGGLSSQTPMVLSYLIVQGGSVQEPALPNTVVPPLLPSNPQSAGASVGASITAALPPSASSILTTNVLVSNGATITQTQLLAPSVSGSGSPPVTGAPNASQSAGGNSALPTGSSGQNTSSNGDTNTATVNGSGSGMPIGAIVGGVLGALLLIAILIICLIFWRRRKRRQLRALETVQVQQPFYSDMAQSQSAVHVFNTGEGSQTFGESQSFHNYNTLHGGNVGGTFTKTRPPENTAFSNLLSDVSPSTPGFSHYQISPHATSSYSRGPESSAGSEATLPSAHGSVAPLLPSERGSSKHSEHLAESSSQAYAGYYTPEPSVVQGHVVNHEDSGYRLPVAGSSQPLRGPVLEFPPAYTTA